METILRTTEKFIPSFLYRLFQPAYHFVLATLGALIYRFPSKHINVIGITGTKGKTSVVEFVDAVLRASGKKTALLSTLHFKIGDTEERNLYKMTMPGRFFVQRFLRRAVSENCDWAVIEMTSEGAKFFRHKYIDLNAFIFTNITPEHIESHGSFENYLNAKLSLAKQLNVSKKKNKAVVVNGDDTHGTDFSDAAPSAQSYEYRKGDVTDFVSQDTGISFTYKGVSFTAHLPGEFTLYNVLSAIKLGEHVSIPLETIQQGIDSLKHIRGRAEAISLPNGAKAIVDYAHTIESLEAIYSAYPGKKIAILGSTGGGRDTWKRKKMGETANAYCQYVIVTNEDPYDEDPQKIIDDVSSGVVPSKLEKILDRREAIASALKQADRSTTIIISGKGTDPYIMGPNGSKEEWDDATVVREEIAKL